MGGCEVEDAGVYRGSADGDGEGVGVRCQHVLCSGIDLDDTVRRIHIQPQRPGVRLKRTGSETSTNIDFDPRKCLNRKRLITEGIICADKQQVLAIRCSISHVQRNVKISFVRNITV